MKKVIVLSLALALPTFGGSSSKAVIEAAPEPAPTLWQWFAGGSFGQFSIDGSSSFDGTGFIPGATAGSFRTEISDVDLDMYSLHLGRPIKSAAGFDLAAYFEVAWLTGDFTATGIFNFAANNVDLVLFRENFDLDIVPVTLNLKAERNLYGPVGAYLSGGLGYAWTSISGVGDDENGGGFYAQAAAGLVWNVNSSVDIYGGARWVYLSDLEFGDDDFGFGLDNQLGWEIGLRYKF